MAPMYECALFIVLLVIGIIAYEQHDSIYTLERVELSEANSKHIGQLKASTNKYNRTQAVVNATLEFKSSFENDLEIHSQHYKFSSNEYRLFPIEMNMNLCKILTKGDFGVQNLYDCGSFPRCPIKKGLYFLCNWYPDARKFPPFHPIGRYLGNMTFYFHHEKVFRMLVYYKVEKVIKYI